MKSRQDFNKVPAKVAHFQVKLKIRDMPSKLLQYITE